MRSFVEKRRTAFFVEKSSIFLKKSLDISSASRYNNTRRQGHGPRPSGKAKVCKTFIHQFKSGRHLHKTVMKKMSQSFFFVVASKIGDFANRFLNTVLQCCPTIFGRFAHPEAHFLCHFLEFGRGVGNFFEKKQNKSCCFQNVFNFLAANFLLAAGIF